MKKIYCDHFSTGKWKKTLFLMRLSVAAFFCSVTFTIAAPAFSQQTRFDVSYERKALGEVLNDLKKRSGYQVVYIQDVVPENELVTLTKKNAEIGEILSDLLTPYGLGYAIEDDIIMITPLKKDQEQQPSRITFKGKVIDTRGNPVMGAAVSIKGTTVGMVVDINGNFSLTFPYARGTVIQVQMLGMVPQEIVWGEINDPAVRSGQKELIIRMEESAENIDDVVVTGYANINKSSFTGSYTVITREELLRVSPRNVLNSLQVFEPSLRMSVNNAMGSDPNTMPEMYLRGRSGLDGVTELDKIQSSTTTGDLSKFALQNNPNIPLFILDGFETTITRVYDLDPNRIETITILKDATATAMYGARADNGVIIIETVAPKPGEVQISYSGNVALEVPDLRGYNLMNAREKLQAELLAGAWDFGYDPRYGDYRNTQNYQAFSLLQNLIAAGVDTDWIAQPLRNGVTHSHNLYFSGGVDSFRFGAGLNYKT